MHATPEKRTTASIKTETQAGPTLPAAFRSALAGARPPTASDAPKGADGHARPGVAPQDNQKVGTTLPARNLTLAPRKGHR